MSRDGPKLRLLSQSILNRSQSDDEMRVALSGQIDSAGFLFRIEYRKAILGAVIEPKLKSRSQMIYVLSLRSFAFGQTEDLIKPGDSHQLKTM